MNCVSWNIRGLESPDRKFVIKKYIDSQISLDFLMLQEIKAVDFTLYNNLAYIWKDAVKFHTLHTRGKGGVALLVHPKWSSCIIDHGVSPCNRAVWVTIKYNNNSFGICSVYASNDWKERITLWDWIDNLPDLPWIVGGDFNMIESQADKEGGLPFT